MNLVTFYKHQREPEPSTNHHNIHAQTQLKITNNSNLGSLLGAPAHLYESLCVSTLPAELTQKAERQKDLLDPTHERLSNSRVAGYFSAGQSRHRHVYWRRSDPVTFQDAVAPLFKEGCVNPGFP